MGRYRFNRAAGQRFVSWMQPRRLESFNPTRSFRHHEGDGDGAGAGSGAGGSGDGDGGTGGSGDGDGDGSGDGSGSGSGSGGGDGDGNTFNQKQVNAILKREKDKMEAKYKQQIQKQLDEVNQLKKAKDLTEAQRKKLDDRAASLQAELLTEREKAEAEKKRADEKHRTELDGVSAERDTWKGRYEDDRRENAILRAASKHDAYNAKQLVGLIAPKVKVTEVLDDDGNGTSIFKTSIDAEVKEGDKMVMKNMTVDQYVEHMKGQDEFANLFIVKRIGGTGHRQGGTQVGGKDTSHLSPTDKIAAGLAKNQATPGGNSAI